MGDLTKNFSRGEFACKCGCGFDTIDYEVLNELQRIRDEWGYAVNINSACRCEAHNKAVGGGKKSQHLKGRAVDFVIRGILPQTVYDNLKDNWEGGLGLYRKFTHIDSRNKKARW